MDEQIREEQAVEEQLGEEPTGDEQASEDQPVEGDTMKSRGRKRKELDATVQPTDEQPTDEQRTDEQPTDAQPTDEQPTDEQPTDEQPTDTQPTGRKTRRAADSQAADSRKVKIPKCPEDRDYCPSCAAYRDGKCAALADFTFSDSRHDCCPFYKERDKAREERLAAMEKLEDTENRHLIRKCYGGPNKFNWILGNELVGISYNFDDDGLEYVAEEEEEEGDLNTADNMDASGGPIAETVPNTPVTEITSNTSDTITEMEESK